MRLEVTKSHSTDRMSPHKYRGSLFRHPGVFCCWGNYCWLAIDLWRGHYSVCFNLWFHYVIWWLHPSATPGNYPLSRPGLPPLNTTSVLLWESPGSCYLNALPCNQRFLSGLACSMCGVVYVAVRLFTPLRGKKSSQIRECQRRERKTHSGKKPGLQRIAMLGTPKERYPTEYREESNLISLVIN